MIYAHLERFCYAPLVTLGRLIISGESTIYQGYTVERPWKRNERHTSCIPEGEYTAKRGIFPRHGETFEVLVKDRTAILFHVANIAGDVEGCIGLGERLGVINQDWAVLSSRPSFDRFMDVLRGVERFSLRIYHYHAEGVEDVASTR